MYHTSRASGGWIRSLRLCVGLDCMLGLIQVETVWGLGLRGYLGPPVVFGVVVFI